MTKGQIEILRLLIRTEIATAISRFVENADNAAHNASLAQEMFDALLSTAAEDADMKTLNEFGKSKFRPKSDELQPIPNLDHQVQVEVQVDKDTDVRIKNVGSKS